MTPGEAPKPDYEAQVKSNEARLAELDKSIAEVKDNRSILEAAINARKLLQLQAQRKRAEEELAMARKLRDEQKAKEATEKAEVARKAEEERKAKEAAEAAKKPVEAQPVTPAAPATAPAPQPAPTEAPAEEKPAEELGFLGKLLQNDKVLTWLENMGLGGVAEAFASFFGINIDRAQKQNERLAEGSNAAINPQELETLKQLAQQPKLPEFKDTNDPKDEAAPWKHVAGWLGLSGKISNQADFFAVVTKGKSKVDLGADKGGMQEVPNFISFKETPTAGYKAGDVVIYQNKNGDRIPATVVDAGDPTNPVMSFVHSEGILPPDKPFEASSLVHQVKGTLNDPLVKKALENCMAVSIFRTAALKDQQDWYLAKNPPKPQAPAQPTAPQPAVAGTPAPAPTTPAAPAAPATAPTTPPQPTVAAATQPAPTQPAPAPTPAQPAAPAPAAGEKPTS